MHSVYLIQSETSKQFYIGQTADLKERLLSHNENKNKSTKHKGPWKLIYCEVFAHKTDALIRERKLKNHGKGLSELKKRLLHSCLD